MTPIWIAQKKSFIWLKLTKARYKMSADQNGTEHNLFGVQISCICTKMISFRFGSHYLWILIRLKSAFYSRQFICGLDESEKCLSLGCPVLVSTDRGCSQANKRIPWKFTDNSMNVEFDRILCSIGNLIVSTNLYSIDFEPTRWERLDISRAPLLIELYFPQIVNNRS